MRESCKRCLAIFFNQYLILSYKIQDIYRSSNMVSNNLNCFGAECKWCTLIFYKVFCDFLELACEALRCWYFVFIYHYFVIHNKDFVCNQWPMTKVSVKFKIFAVVSDLPCQFGFFLWRGWTLRILLKLFEFGLFQPFYKLFMVYCWRECKWSNKSYQTDFFLQLEFCFY